MRIVAGQMKGRRLVSPRTRSTRATSDRVREAIFSILVDVTGANVLDLFAGTGALGLEALSRGAAHATFVENDHAAVAVLQANITKCKADDQSGIIRVDALVARPKLTAHAPFDLIFIDPPYADAPRFRPKLDGLVSGLIAPGGRVVIESDRRDALQLSLPIYKEKRYGDTLVRFHQLGSS